MALVFRNIKATPRDPVEEWGVEGLLTAIERGGLVHLRRITQAVQADAYGTVADDLAEAVQLTDSPIAARLSVILDEARGGAEAVVRRHIRDAVAQSGASLREFAGALGTSASRLSTYAAGKVQPSAAMYLRILDTGRQLSVQGQTGPSSSRRVQEHPIRVLSDPPSPWEL